MSRSWILATSVSLALSVGLAAQPTPPPGMTFEGSYDLGRVSGIAFSPDGSVLRVHDGVGGVINEFPVLRDPSTQRVTGFGPASLLISNTNGAQASSGLLFMPNGTVIWAAPNGSHQYTASGVLSSFVTPHATVTSLSLIPSWMPTAGRVYYGRGQGRVFIADLTESASGDGTWEISNASSLGYTNATGLLDLHGLATIPTGPFKGSLLMGIGNLTDGLVIGQIDPATGTATGQVTLGVGGVPRPRAMAFDPVTDDLFVSELFGTDRLKHFSGFISDLYAPTCSGTATLAGDDFLKAFKLDGVAQFGGAVDVAPGQLFTYEAFTASGAFTGSPLLVGIELLTTGTAPVGAVPGVCHSWDPATWQIIVGYPTPAALPIGGYALSGVYPGGLAGLSVFVQALVADGGAANGSWATNDPVELRFQ